jgi:predicted DNA-binding transcriptional regulator YafY
LIRLFSGVSQETKQESTVPRSSRLFEIIQVLRQARAPMPAHAIVSTLEVNKRTIYRDIATLQSMRIPIEGEAGVGYVMRPGFDLPPLMFTPDEIEAIIVGLSLLGRTGDSGLQAAASGVTRKLADVLPSRQRCLDELPLHVSQWSAIPPAGVKHHTIREAIRDERKLRLDYRDCQDRETTRTIYTIALVYYIDSVVLAGWCELRGDYRHFRIDRIIACCKTDALFRGDGQRLRSEWPSRTSLLSPTLVRAS